VVALFGEGEGRFAVVGGGSGVCAMSDEDFDDVEITVGGGFEKRGMAFGIAVVYVGAIFDEPFGDGNVVAGDGAGERGVARTIFGDCVDVSPLRVEIAGYIFVAENSGESHYREAIGREGGSGGGMGIDKFADAWKISGGGSFMEFEMGAVGDEQIANFFATHVAGHKNGGDALIIFGVRESGIGGEERGECGEVAGADGLEKIGLAHRCLQGRSRKVRRGYETDDMLTWGTAPEQEMMRGASVRTARKFR